MNSLPSWLKETEEGTVLEIYVQPGAKRYAAVGEFNGRLKVAITAPPVEGKANAHLVRLLARWLKVSKSDVTLVAGETSRTKRLAVRGVTPAGAAAALAG